MAKYGECCLGPMQIKMIRAWKYVIQVQLVRVYTHVFKKIIIARDNQVVRIVGVMQVLFQGFRR